MRRRLAWVFVALAVMLVVGFLVPLGLSLRSQAELRSLAAAQSDARGVATALAASARATSRNPGAIDVQFVLDSFGSEDLAVFLPDGTRLGDGYTPENAVDLADDGAIVARIDGGVLAVVPVTFQTSGARLVVTAFVSNADLQEGVATSWLILAVLGLIVVLGAVPLADRLAASIVKPVRELSDTAHRWAGGDLEARVVPDGPEEVAESGRAFNQLVERLAELLAAERERVADLSHRLRTPIAALRLQADSVVDPVAREGLISDIVHLEGEVTALIEDVRRTGSDESTICDLGACIGKRMGFWRVVASAQQRTVDIDLETGSPVLVDLPAAEVLSILDNLVQNVLTHTVVGVGFTVSVSGGPPRLTISDEGDGLPSADVFDRGSGSGQGSGLGLDIVRRLAEQSGGEVAVGEGAGQLSEGRMFKQFLPMVRENGGRVYLMPDPETMESIDATELVENNLKEPELAELAAQADYVMRF